MAKRFAVVLVAWVCCVGPVAMAQVSSIATEAPPPPQASSNSIPLGPFLFTPGVQVTWEDRDNIYFTPTDEVSDQVLVARARLMLEVPVFDSYVRFAYTPQYREFQDTYFPEHWTHVLDAAGTFEFASGLKVTADYRFFDGALEVREIDPGAELMFGENPFTKHYLQLVADYWFTHRDGLRVEGAFTRLDYDDTAVQEPDRPEYTFYDYDETLLGIAWLHQLNPTLVGSLEYRRRDFDSADTFSYRDQASDELTLGFEGQITPLLSSGIRGGWRITELDLDDDQTGLEDYEDPYLNGYLNYELAHGSGLRLDLIYTDYASNFQVDYEDPQSPAAAYYVARGASLMYGLQREKLFAQARVRFQNNSYDDLTPSRDDDILTFNVGLGYRFNELITLQGAFLREKRETSPAFEDLYSYTYNSFVLGVVLGYWY